MGDDCQRAAIRGRVSARTRPRESTGCSQNVRVNDFDELGAMDPRLPEMMMEKGREIPYPCYSDKAIKMRFACRLRKAAMMKRRLLLRE